MTNRKRKRFYVGRTEGALVVFRSATLPTEKSHGAQYRYAVGPFRTYTGARFMADYGHDNPHCVTVSQAEKLARKEPRT